MTHVDNRRSVSWSRLMPCFCTLAIMTSFEDYFPCSRFAPRRAAHIYTAVEPSATTMSRVHACPCPGAHPFFKSLSMPLSRSVRTLSFIINMLFTNSHSSVQTTHSGVHAFTCVSLFFFFLFPHTSWIINNLYCGTNSPR